MTLTRLSSEQIDSKLTEASGWKLQDSKLHREFAFIDFVEAFGFMSRVALLAETAGIIRNGSMCTTRFELISRLMMSVESAKLILILLLRSIASTANNSQQDFMKTNQVDWISPTSP